MSARVCVHVRVHVCFCAYAHTSTHLSIYMRAAPERTHTPALTRSLSLTHTHAHSLTHSPIHTHTRVHCTGNTLITLSRTEGLSLYHFPTLALRTRLAPMVCVCMCVHIYTNSVYIHYTCLAQVAYVYRYSIDHIHNINIYTCMNTNIHKYTHTFILGNPFCKGGLQNAGVWVWSAFSKLVFGSSGTNVPKTGYNNPLDGPNPEFGNPLAGELLTMNIQTYMHTFLTINIHTYMHTYIHICIHTYAYIHTYIHICIHTYILTCIHPTNTQTQMLIIHKHTFRQKKKIFLASPNKETRTYFLCCTTITTIQRYICWISTQESAQRSPVSVFCVVIIKRTIDVVHTVGSTRNTNNDCNVFCCIYV